MKKVTDLLIDLRASWSFLTRSNKTLIYVECHYCKSAYVKFEKGQENANSYTSQYTCLKCGSTCTNLEVWEPKKETGL